MIFNNHQPIYVQIIDLIYKKILSDEWIADLRIPSVRDMAVKYEVNPNTVMRAYEKLQARSIIYNKRGMGYFLSTDAKEQVLREQCDEFVTNELPKLFERMSALGYSIDQLKDAYDKFEGK